MKNKTKALANLGLFVDYIGHINCLSQLYCSSQHGYNQPLTRHGIYEEALVERMRRKK